MILDTTATTDQILERIVALIHAAMERKHGPTVGYGVGRNSKLGEPR